MKELRREIGRIRPDQCVELWVDAELGEILEVPERLEHWPDQLRREVDLSSGTIFKPKPHNMPADVPRFNHVIVHLHYFRAVVGATA